MSSSKPLFSNLFRLLVINTCSKFMKILMITSFKSLPKITKFYIMTFLYCGSKKELKSYSCMSFFKPD